MGRCKDVQMPLRTFPVRREGPLLFKIKVVVGLQTSMLAEGLAPTTALREEAV